MLQSRKNETQSLRNSMFGASTTRKLPAREIASRCCNSSGIASVAMAPPTSPVASRRCPSPSFNRKALPQTPPLQKRSLSAERKRPTTPSSPTSSPASPWRLSPRSSTPVDEAVKALHHSTRKQSTDRKPDVPWPAMRNLSASFQIECSSDALAKRPQKPVSGSNIAHDHRFKPSSILSTEKKRSTSRGKNSSNGSENSKPAENYHPRSKEHDEPNRKFCNKTSSCVKPGTEISNSSERISTRLLRSCSVQTLESPRKSPFNVPSPVRPSSPLPSKNNYAMATISSSSMSRNHDFSKRRKNSTRTGEDFKLRMLHNRYLQWLFVNSRANASMLIQKNKSERILYSVWAATWKMRQSVVLKGIHIQRLRLEMKSASILTNQVLHLEEWGSVEREHSCSLSEAIDVLRVTTLPLPLGSGAKAEVNALKDAISSAVDVLQSMSSPVRHMISRLEGVNSCMSELTQLATEERIMLDECRKLLSSTAALWNGGCFFLLHRLWRGLLDQQLIGNHDDEHVPVAEVFALFCSQLPNFFLKSLEELDSHVLEIILSLLQVYYHLNFISIFEKSLRSF